MQAKHNLIISYCFWDQLTKALSLSFFTFLPCTDHLPYPAAPCCPELHASGKGKATLERLAGSKSKYLLYCFENTDLAPLARWDATPVTSGGFWLWFTDSANFIALTSACWIINYNSFNSLDFLCGEELEDLFLLTCHDSLLPECFVSLCFGMLYL